MHANSYVSSLFLYIFRYEYICLSVYIILCEEVLEKNPSLVGRPTKGNFKLPIVYPPPNSGKPGGNNGCQSSSKQLTHHTYTTYTCPHLTNPRLVKTLLGFKHCTLLLAKSSTTTTSSPCKLSAMNNLFYSKS